VPRLPLKQDKDLDAGTLALFEGIVQRGGQIPDLYRLLAHAPDLLKAWTDLAWPLRNVGYASRGLRELMIMRTAQLDGADYEWAHHWRLALGAGITERQLTELADWQTSDCYSLAERAALAFADELIKTGHISDGTFEAVRAEFDGASVIQLVLTISFYVCVARFSEAFQLEIEPKYRSVPGSGRKA
jgi:alkylhydroperoxidase family enzyme